MSPAPVVALLTAPRVAGETGLEWLRAVGALVACGQPLRLVLAGAGRGALDPEALDDEALRYVETLADLGVAAEALEGAALATALTGASGLLRLADPARAGRPPLLRLAADGPLDPEALAEAGQVILADPATSRPPRRN